MMEIAIGFIFDTSASVTCSGSVRERVGVTYLLSMSELSLTATNQ